MKISQRIKIDIWDFITTGTFDVIQLGQTKEWILANFPNPDRSVHYQMDLMDPMNNMWQYGSFQFFFNDNDELYFIGVAKFNDPSYLPGKWHSSLIGNGFSLDVIHGIFEKPAKLTLAFMMETFLQHEISFIVKKGEESDNILLKIESSNVRLTFHTRDQEKKSLKDYKCISISLRNDI